MFGVEMEEEEERGVFREEGLGRWVAGLKAALVGAWWALGLEFWGLRGTVWWDS